MSKFIKVLIASMMCMLTMALTSCHHLRLHEDSETHVYDADVPFTVQNYLQLREDMRKNAYIDSVFMCMPEQILTHILVNHGTDLEIKEIVTIYLSDKKAYDEVILPSMNVQKQYVPDSMPNHFDPANPLSIPDQAEDITLPNVKRRLGDEQILNSGEDTPTIK